MFYFAKLPATLVSYNTPKAYFRSRHCLPISFIFLCDIMLIYNLLNSYLHYNLSQLPYHIFHIYILEYFQTYKYLFFHIPFPSKSSTTIPYDLEKFFRFLIYHIFWKAFFVASFISYLIKSKSD